MIINHNVPALQAYNALSVTNSNLQKSINRLSTGLRINSAADDAAGLAISEKMRAQIRGLDRAVSNAQDGISMIQTAEGALGETHSILQRMRELSVQAANDTLTQEDRGYIQLEIDQLKEEVSRIANTTQFNKKKLLDGSAAALWSSDNLQTRAIVNGGLRQIDQFGQKAAVEGNFKISINTDPGQAEIQKSDIFKIKHKNVIMNVSLDKSKGMESVSVDNLPAGVYKIYQEGVEMTAINGVAYRSGNNPTNMGTAGLTAHSAISARSAGHVDNHNPHGSAIAQVASRNSLTSYGYWSLVPTADQQANAPQAARSAHSAVAGAANKHQTIDFAGMYGISTNPLLVNFSGSNVSNVKNASYLFEVVNYNSAQGSQSITFRVRVNVLYADGKVGSFYDDNFVVNSAGITTGQTTLGFNALKASAIMLNMNAAAWAAIGKGDKLVMNSYGTGNTQIAVSATINKDWPDAWYNGGVKSNGGASIVDRYQIDASAVRNQDVQFKQFYLNTANGTVYEGNIVIGFSTAFARNLKGLGAAFEAAYIGQVAKGDVKLRDLDKFWDANGKFLLDDPKEVTIYQGDGTKASIRLYATDTLEEVRSKLNDAVANSLGQSKYVKTAGAQFVSFVEADTYGAGGNVVTAGNQLADNPMSVAGTFVIRSLIPGNGGKLSFSGDEDIIKALSLNVIQEARESTYMVSVADAHNSKSIASGVKVTGNILYGIVNPNVDVQFDAMANVNVSWDEVNKKFILKKDTGAYETILHLADNTTVFQIGANEGEDMGVNIGDMSARALGVANVLVTNREAAARSITMIDNAISKVSTQRAKLGAYQNRLEHTINNLTTASTNTTAAESRIRDADMAKEMMEFTKLNILSQAGNSMLAQANQLPQSILSLLR